MDKEIKIIKLPLIGTPLSYRTARWKKRLTVNSEDLKALKKTIAAADKKQRKGK